MDKYRNIAILDLVRMIRKELHPFTFPSQNLHFVDIGLVDINNKPEIDRVYDWKMLHETDLNAEKIVEAGNALVEKLEKVSGLDKNIDPFTKAITEREFSQFPAKFRQCMAPAAVSANESTNHADSTKLDDEVLVENDILGDTKRQTKMTVSRWGRGKNNRKNAEKYANDATKIKKSQVNRETKIVSKPKVSNTSVKSRKLLDESVCNEFLTKMNRDPGDGIPATKNSPMIVHIPGVKKDFKILALKAHIDRWESDFEHYTVCDQRSALEEKYREIRHDNFVSFEADPNGIGKREKHDFRDNWPIYWERERNTDCNKYVKKKGITTGGMKKNEIPWSLSRNFLELEFSDEDVCQWVRSMGATMRCLPGTLEAKYCIGGEPRICG